jgi:hypothetical protein
MRETAISTLVIINLFVVCSSLVMGAILTNPCLAASGGMIDIFTDKGGLGSNQSGGIFQPNELVNLIALVTSNGDPIVNGLVSFEIQNQKNPIENITIIQVASTNRSGMAEASFRIPLPHPDLGAIVYGNWTVIVTANVGDETLSDALTFLVIIRGDVNHDGRVDASDLVLLAEAYSSRPNDPNWNPDADIDNDQYVGLADLSILALNFGQHYP